MNNPKKEHGMRGERRSVRVGIDIGSTTAKLVALGVGGEILYAKYVRHHARINETLCGILREMAQSLGETDLQIRITGSVGMAVAERLEVPFVQEVVAASKAVRNDYPQVRSLIDIGGEDAKVVFFEHGAAKDLRMNGNCAGGTGAFIDQMAILLGVEVQEMGELAQRATRVYPIASRCGVFCKTDIQNLMAKNVPKADIAASIFHAVAVQTVVTLAHGCDIQPPVLFCGGPLTFIPALRQAFAEYLHLAEAEMVLPRSGALLPAIGTALSCTEGDDVRSLSEIIGKLESAPTAESGSAKGLESIFADEQEYRAWKRRMEQKRIPTAPLRAGRHEAYLGIDSGSTTTKIVVTDAEGRLLFTHYHPNGGNALGAVADGLLKLRKECEACGAELCFRGSCSTGYGEDLIKAAFRLNAGIVETIAHYLAARHVDKDVSFILDIGGQDMKAMFVDGGVVNRIEINEACSSGCGSFIETFAKTLGYTAQAFSQAACLAAHPSDLGTRCTVFMNSKVKQVLREGATVNDIAAGLAYSVVRNCLYKVLKLKDVSALGRHIVVQGGTMRNDAVVRALERLTDAEVSRCDVPELMGAYGCALYAARHASSETSLEEMLGNVRYSSTLLHCKGCSNRCLVSCYRFAGGRKYYSGNRCERVFANGEYARRGLNAYEWKYSLLFDRAAEPVPAPRLKVGIPRCLDMYENFPFWHTLFTECGIQVVLSSPSDFTRYEGCARMVMSDNICFPAKLVHSHVQNLADEGVDRIFMPFTIFERKADGEQNSYNCPIVTGYSEVVRSVQSGDIPIDSPSVSFRDRKLLLRQCRSYLESIGVESRVAERAFVKAVAAQEAYVRRLVERNEEIWREAAQSDRFVILLAGRPYHADPLIQHKIADMMAGMGIDVITDDIVRDKQVETAEVNFLPQWTYPNRILKAARWCVQQTDNLQFVQLTSFGCGPDAFLTDGVRDLLMQHGKTYTLLKLDDINNVGSMKLRVRSLVESLRLKEARVGQARQSGETHRAEAEDWRGRKILVPFFTPFISPLIPAIMQVAGYDADVLPPSDEESCEWGLKYANNEVCYPATLIVSDIIKAFRKGLYSPDNTVIAMTQTGGQCRASNYVALIRKALADAGYAHTPVVPLTFGGRVEAGSAGLRVNWLKIVPVTLAAVLYADCISKFYHATAPREIKAGRAAELRDAYLSLGAELIRRGKASRLYDQIGLAARQFNEACRDTPCPKVGVVGEIFLKFNPFAHRNVTRWLMDRGIEVVPSALTDFFAQAFVNAKVRRETHIERGLLPKAFYEMGYNLIYRQIERVNKAAEPFRRFTPFGHIFVEAEAAQRVISLNAQFGEGWLLPAEIMAYASQGVNHVVSLQPFGCIANHIVSKGIEKRIKTLLPHMNLLSLDFDSGVSEVNITNRLLLFVDGLAEQTPQRLTI